MKYLVLVLAFVCQQTFAFNNFHSVPGGIAGVLLAPVTEAEAPRAWFGDTELLVVGFGDQWVAIVGLDWRQSPGFYVVKSRVAEHPFESHTFSVKALRRPIHTVELAPGTRAETVSSKYFAALERNQSLPLSVAEGGPDLNFRIPVDRRIRYAYGWLRPKGENHLLPYPGIGFDNPDGIPAINPAFGQVASVVEVSGGSEVVIDHGSGLVSVLRNLRVTTISPEDWIPKGGIIGTLQPNRGKSLLPDWSVFLNEAPVDPMLLVSRRVQLETSAPPPTRESKNQLE